MFSDALVICEALQEQDYASPKNKLAALKKQGVYYQIRHGRYETERDVPGHLLACAIYGPSYLSFEYALFVHGLIPERVSVYTSATTGKNRTKRFSNRYGTYTYQDVPRAAYPHETVVKVEQDRGYLIATPEKALCDTLCKQKPVTSVKALRALLFENLRIDEEAFSNLDGEALLFLCPLYRKKNLNFLARLIEKDKAKTAASATEERV